MTNRKNNAFSQLKELKTKLGNNKGVSIDKHPQKLANPPTTKPSAPQKPAPAIATERPPSNDDAELFSQAMRDVVRSTASDKTARTTKPIDTTPKFRLHDEAQALQDFQLGRGDLAVDDELSYFQPHVPKKTRQQLRRGLYSVQGELDLHRHTLPMAKPAVKAFLQQAHQRGLSCVRIVPGKGLHSQKQPVLRNWLVQNLKQRDNVLGFTPAPDHDGGSGAFYLLLKQ